MLTRKKKEEKNTQKKKRIIIISEKITEELEYIYIQLVDISK